MTSLPILIEISPIAHVALLHTDIYSGFRFVANIGIISPEIHNIRYHIVVCWSSTLTVLSDNVITTVSLIKKSNDTAER